MKMTNWCEDDKDVDKMSGDDENDKSIWIELNADNGSHEDDDKSVMVTMKVTY